MSALEVSGKTLQAVSDQLSRLEERVEVGLSLSDQFSKLEERVDVGLAFNREAFASAPSCDSRDHELVADGAWCWFQDPRAVHYVGTRDRTYISLT